MSFELMFSQANALFAAGEFDRAEPLYRQVLAANPRNPDVLNMLGLAAQAKGAHEQAVDLFHQAIALTPDFFPLHFNMAFSLEALGRFGEALAAYERNGSAEAWERIGGIHWKLGDLEAAREAYRRALPLPEAAASLAFLDNDKAALATMDSNTARFYLARLSDSEEALALLAKVSDPRARLAEGEILLRLGRREEALAALRAAPDCAEKFVNLGNLEGLESHYSRALELDSESFDAHFNYANWLAGKRRIAEALEECRAAVRIDPNRPEALNTMATLLPDGLEKADLFFAAFAANPSESKYALNLAETLMVYAQSSEEALEEARKMARHWAGFALSSVFARNVLAVLEGREADDGEFSKALFDQFSETYEQTLSNINYNIPYKIKEILGDIKGEVLDLGCGTGLVGAAVKGSENRLVGVDISPKMLEIARGKGVYDELACADIVEFLRESGRRFDWVIAADVFCYIKELEDIFKVLDKQKICFSIEVAEGESHRQLNGRYRHNPDAVKKTLSDCGYAEVRQYPLVLRQENGADVAGMVFAAE